MAKYYPRGYEDEDYSDFMTEYDGEWTPDNNDDDLRKKSASRRKARQQKERTREASYA